MRRRASVARQTGKAERGETQPFIRQHVEACDRAVEAFQGELAEWLAFREVVDGAEQALGDKALARLRLPAQVRGEVGTVPMAASSQRSSKPMARFHEAELKPRVDS